MDDLKLLEWMDLIDIEYIKEAQEPLGNNNSDSGHIVRWWYYIGMAAGLTVAILSGSILIAGGFHGEEGGLDSGGYLGTMASENGNLVLALLMLSLALSGYFLYLIIRRKHDGR